MHASLISSVLRIMCLEVYLARDAAYRRFGLVSDREEGNMRKKECIGAFCNSDRSQLRVGLNLLGARSWVYRRDGPPATRQTLGNRVGIISGWPTHPVRFGLSVPQNSLKPSKRLSQIASIVFSENGFTRVDFTV